MKLTQQQWERLLELEKKANEDEYNMTESEWEEYESLSELAVETMK
jgi:hypothetical protein